MNQFQDLYNSDRRRCFSLKFSEPGSSPDTYRVVMVFEGVSGYFHTGGGNVEPWYWDQAVCDDQNKRRFNLSPQQAQEIINSSFAKS